MKITNTLSLAAYSGIALGLLAVNPQAAAHTRLEHPVVKEGVRTDTNVVIPHGCDGQPVIGNVFFFPNQTDSRVQTSTDSFATFTDSPLTALDFLQSRVLITPIKSREVFDLEERIADTEGNGLGFWAAIGEIPASGWVGKLPVRIGAANIATDSCAKSVTIVPAIANVCALSKASAPNFNAENSGGLVDLWTAPDNGTPFDAPAWNFPASYKIERDLENNPFPASCDLDGDGIDAGETFDVRIFPSAAQTLKDMPVFFDGVQVWPTPE
ncbi:MAG: hypothetical protein CVV13_07800 [Gammaproteobacteria bacterium HGW-Gammaproteobacteria-3]|jgi:hypothetical protein|nr:MAG: hypothetical protein CVV13_07800 [Gammaproteobacteria bacterium HGW-Gammaproteobacteria-3]